jgi:serine/threonine protein kinase
MFQNIDLSKEINIINIIGNGSFGSVYVCELNNYNKNLALKCEKIKNNTVYTEFKIYSRIYNIKNYLNNIKININEEHIQIYNYLNKNNILTIPDIISENILKNDCIVPFPYSYYKCEDFYFLLMELCGDNFENIIKNYKLTEKCKYHIAHELLFTMASFHRCGLIHRDMKLANLVLNTKIDSTNPKNLKLMLIDLGLSKEFYTFSNKQVSFVKPTSGKNITGTIRYISLNIHEFNSPTIIDDLISMCYMLVNIFTEKNLPWIGHKNDEKQFNRNKHQLTNCKCKYHENIINKKTKNNNTIAEIKYHTPLKELCGDYTFLSKWLKYLYSLNLRQMPSYTYLTQILTENTPVFNNKLQFEFIKKNN